MFQYARRLRERARLIDKTAIEEWARRLLGIERRRRREAAMRDCRESARFYMNAACERDRQNGRLQARVDQLTRAAAAREWALDAAAQAAFGRPVAVMLNGAQAECPRCGMPSAVFQWIDMRGGAHATAKAGEWICHEDACANLIVSEPRITYDDALPAPLP